MRVMCHVVFIDENETCLIRCISSLYRTGGPYSVAPFGEPRKIRLWGGQDGLLLGRREQRQTTFSEVRHVRVRRVDERRLLLTQLQLLQQTFRLPKPPSLVNIGL